MTYNRSYYQGDDENLNGQGAVTPDGQNGGNTTPSAETPSSVQGDVTTPDTNVPTSEPAVNPAGNAAGTAAGADVTFTQQQLNDVDNGSSAITNGIAAKNVQPADPSHITKNSLEGKELEIKPTYLVDWSKGTSLADAVKYSDRSPLELIRDRERWARDTGGEPMDIFELYALTQNGQDLTMSKEDAEKAEKKRRRQERWQSIGNVLAHLGNFIGTIGGAPSQPIESAIELSKRQQALRDKTEALRRADNNKLLELYMKQQAERRAQDIAARTAAYQQRQLDITERKTDIAQQNADRLEAQMWLNENFRNRQMDFKEAQQAALEDYRRGMLSQGAMRIAVSQINASGKTTTTEETRINPVTGQPYTNVRTQVTTPGTGGRQTSSGGGQTNGGRQRNHTQNPYD